MARKVTSNKDSGSSNVEDLDLDAIPGASRGEQIAHEMGCAGFVRKTESLSPNYVEYARSYVDTSGTVGLVTAMIRKDDAGMEPDVLEGFVLTVQKHVRAIPENVHNEAWKFAKDDLLHLIEVIGAADEPSAERHIVMHQCDSCNVNTPDSLPLGKKRLCKDCYDKASI